MLAPPKLPREEEKEMPGFVSHIDPATGRTFYVNTATGISQWWAPLPPPLPFSPPPPPTLPSAPILSTAENDFFSGEMKPMGINTFEAVQHGGQPQENCLLLLFKGRQYRALHCLGWCAFSVLTYHGITSMCSIFSINSMFSVASVNSIFSAGSVNR